MRISLYHITQKYVIVVCFRLIFPDTNSYKVDMYLFKRELKLLAILHLCIFFLFLLLHNFLNFAWLFKILRFSKGLDFQTSPSLALIVWKVSNLFPSKFYQNETFWHRHVDLRTIWVPRGLKRDEKQEASTSRKTNSWFDPIFVSNISDSILRILDWIYLRYLVIINQNRFSRDPFIKF